MEQDIPLKQVAKKAVYLAEKEAIERAIVQSSGNKSRVSKILKINYKTLLSKIKEYRIKNGTDGMENVP